MKSEIKQKLLNSFKDWKTYVFVILPLAMFVAFFAILAWQIKNGSHSVLLIIVAIALFSLAVILLSCLSIINSLKYKCKRNIAVACLIMAFSLAFTSVTIYNATRIPELVAAQEIADQRFQEYVDADKNDKESYSAKHDAWRDALDVSRSISSDMSALQRITDLVYVIVLSAMQLLIIKKPEQDGENKENCEYADDKKEKENLD